MRAENQDKPDRSLGQTSYYIDSIAGDDTVAGTNENAAWRSLDRVNNLVLAGGDRVLFKRGSKFVGRLWPKGEGTRERPVLIGAYGQGATPVFDAEGKSPETVRLHNTRFLTLQDLEIVNKGSERVAGLTGVLISLENFGTAQDIVVRHLFVHDVYGSNVKADNGGYGITWKNGGKSKSRFDNLRIEHNRLLRVDRNGITGNSDYCGRTDWYPSLNVRVANNLLEDIGGDGIVPIGTDGCVIENNVIRGCRMRAQDAAAGIWPWSADNTIIQFNEVSGTKGTLDGQSFDADWNCVGTTIQYNYSHDNEGGFVLLCDDGMAGRDWSAGNQKTVVRFNVSVNDGGPGGRSIQLAGPLRDARIYHNTIYLKAGIDQPIVWVNSWGGFPRGVRLENNLFHAVGKTHFHLDGREKAVTFKGNAYSGPMRDLPEDDAALRLDATFVDPVAAEGLAAFEKWMLAENSPLRGKAKALPDSGERDARGARVASDGAVDPGAVQSN